MHVTLVDPLASADPEGGSHVSVLIVTSSGKSIEGFVHCAVAVDFLRSMGCVRFVGQIIDGAENENQIGKGVLYLKIKGSFKAQTLFKGGANVEW